MSDENEVRPGEAQGGERQRQQQEALKAAAETTSPEKLDDSTIETATDYFLSGEPVESTAYPIDLNIAPAGKPRRWVRFKLEVVPRDMIREIRKDSTIDGIEDDMLVNERLTIQGLVDPDLTRQDVRGDMADPSDALQRMLGHKPGLIDKLGQQVLAVSGYDSDDMREVRAAGN